MIIRGLLFFYLAAVYFSSPVPVENSLEWMIIPDKISLYKTPDFSVKTAIEISGFPHTVIDISEFESEGDRSGSQWIKILHENNHYFLPKDLLLQKIQWAESDGNFSLGLEKVDQWNPIPFNYKPNDLIKLPQKWNYHSQKYSKYLRSEVAKMLVEMLTAAEKQNIQIRVVSAFRSAVEQRRLYLRKIKQAGLNQRLVAKPGHSEHQLGTTVDLCGLDPDYVLKAEFGQTKEGKWLCDNALYYGFKQSYTEENTEKTGYSPEPWHFRYIGNANI